MSYGSDAYGAAPYAGEGAAVAGSGTMAGGGLSSGAITGETSGALAGGGTSAGSLTGIASTTTELEILVYSRPVTGAPAVAAFTEADIVEHVGVKVFNDDTGAGSFVVKPTAANIDQIVEDRIASVFFRGQRVWNMVLDAPTITTVSDSFADFAREGTGVGLMGVLAEGNVLPGGGSTYLPAPSVRLFAFMGLDYDISGWSAANDFGAQGSANLPDEWTDPDAHFIGPPSATSTDAPQGLWWAAGEFTVPSDVGEVLIEIQADNAAQLYLGGERVNFDNQPPLTSRRVMKVTPGSTQYLRAEVSNGAPVGTDPNPTWLIITVYEWLGGKYRGAILGRTDSSWKTLDFGSAYPSLLAGAAIIHALQEIQALGILTDLSVSFTETTDTAGAAWPAAFISTQVNGSFLAFIKELVAGGYIWCNLRFTPTGLILDAWAYGTGRADTSVDLHGVSSRSDPASGDLLKLTYRGTRKVADTLIAQYPDGYRYVQHLSSGVHKSVGVVLGTAATEADVDSQGSVLLGIYRNPRAAIDLEPSVHLQTPDSKYPLIGYRIGDTITIPALGGGTTRERVLSVGWTYRTQKRLAFALGIKDIIAEGQDAVLSQLTTTAAQLTRGSVNGSAGIAAPVETATDRQGSPEPFVNHVFDFTNGSDLLVVGSTSHPVQRTGDLLIARATLDETTSSDTTFDVYYLGDGFICTITVPAGQTQGLVLLGDGFPVVRNDQSLYVALTAVGAAPDTLTHAVVELYVG